MAEAQKAKQPTKKVEKEKPYHIDENGEIIYGYFGRSSGHFEWSNLYLNDGLDRDNSMVWMTSPENPTNITYLSRGWSESMPIIRIMDLAEAELLYNKEKKLQEG